MLMRSRKKTTSPLEAPPRFAKLFSPRLPGGDAKRSFIASIVALAITATIAYYKIDSKQASANTKLPVSPMAESGGIADASGAKRVNTGVDASGAREVGPVINVPGARDVKQDNSTGPRIEATINGGERNEINVAAQMTVIHERRERSFVQSDGLDYPVFLVKHLSDSKAITAYNCIGDLIKMVATGNGDELDPAKRQREMDRVQTAIVSGTEVEILKADDEQEVNDLPETLRPMAPLLFDMHTKVLVRQGKHKGTIGWVASVLVKTETVGASK